jgi:GTP-binding protein
MASIYDIKPAFQKLLRPLTSALAAAGVTANQVTVAAALLSAGVGACIWFQPAARWPLLVLPGFLFVRMALNAIDGMLAREHNQKSRLGAVLNEIGDVLADTALYLPLATVPGFSPWLVVVITILAIVSEMTGVVAVQIGATRRYDMNQNIRNIAIIAHVDHGKTTLVDKLLKEGGVYRANQQVQERAMDSMDLEKEKGITIKAKNTSVHWKDKIVNIVDTPGHADFGGEVERALRMVDGVLLVIDAYDGPQAQTRFVLRKALAHGLKVVIVINKIDRDNAEPAKMYDKVLELLMELNATEEQFDAPVVYGSGRDGYMMYHLGEEKKDMTPLFQTISTTSRPRSPSPTSRSTCSSPTSTGATTSAVLPSARFSAAPPRSATRSLSSATPMANASAPRSPRSSSSPASAQRETETAVAGNIVGLSGFEDIDIGDTLTADENGHALPFTQIDPPTLEMQFCVNDGPLVGQEGKLVTSRQLRERLMRELKTNVSIYIEDSDKAGVFNVKARGAMQVAVLVETMRREGFELLVSRPTVIEKTVDGERHEPYETVWIEVPDECVGAIMQNLANRKGHADQHGEAPALHHARGDHHDPRPDRHGNRRRQRHQRPRRAQPPCSRNTAPTPAKSSPASRARSSPRRRARPPPTPSSCARSAASSSSAPASRSTKA